MEKLLEEFPLNKNYPDGTDPNNPIRIYSDGVFDCFHYGHALLFQKIKKFLPHVYLIVGVASDADTTKEKAEPLINEYQRKEVIRHCKWVDEVVDAPWICTLEFLDKIGAHYIAHDPEPYPFENIKDIYGAFKEAKRFIATTRTEGISTTDIINKIISKHEIYIERAIKKKTPIDELNLGVFYYIKYKAIEVFKKIKETIDNQAKEIVKEDSSKVLLKEYIEKKDN